MNQRQILLAVIAVLIPVWWLTRPSAPAVEPVLKAVLSSPPAEAPRFEISDDSQGPELGPAERAMDGSSIARLEASDGPEPAFIAYIDTSRPECLEMKEELLRRLSDGTMTNLIYLGDCDKRLQDKQ